MKKQFVLLIILSTLFFSFSPGICQQIEKDYEEEYDLDFGGEVKVEADEGYIRVESWDQPKVHIFWTKKIWAPTKEEAEKLLEKTEVRISTYKNGIHVQVVEPESLHNFSFWDLLDPDTWNKNYRSPVVNFELKVPSVVNLDLSADEGDISVKHVEGDLNVEVDEGDVFLTDIKFKKLDICSDEGDVKGVDLHNPNGKIVIEIDEGELRLENVEAGRIDFECDEGDATFKNVRCKYCNLTTDEGDIELDIDLQADDSYRVYSDEGNVIFYIASDTNAWLDLKSSDGRIRSDFPVKVTRHDDREACYDKLGNGEALLKAHTDEGSIYLRKR